QIERVEGKEEGDEQRFVEKHSKSAAGCERNLRYRQRGGRSSGLRNIRSSPVHDELPQLEPLPYPAATKRAGEQHVRLADFAAIRDHSGTLYPRLSRGDRHRVGAREPDRRRDWADVKTPGAPVPPPVRREHPQIAGLNYASVSVRGMERPGR